MKLVYEAVSESQTELEMLMGDRNTLTIKYKNKI